MKTATIEKAKKQSKPVIESITIKHMVDDNPDTSYLGEYTDKYVSGTLGCIERQNPGRNEYKYFVPMNSYSQHRKDLQKMGYSRGNCDFLARSYVYQDFRRFERLNRGDWFFMGIMVEATIKLDITGQGNYRLETFTSGGLWGIESDSGNDYIKEIESDELNDLKNHLKQFNVNVKNFDKIEITRKEF